MEENPLSEEDRQRIIDGLMNRKIWWYYKMLSKWAPMLMMLGHWYGVWDYGRHPRAMILDTEVNGNCIIWIYVLAYVYMPLAMIPVSYFFPLLLDIQNTIFLLLRHQCDTALLPTLADNS